MIDKQTELWSDNFLTQKETSDKLKDFVEAWDYVQKTFFSKPPVIAKSDEVIIELNGITTAVKYDPQANTITIP